MDIVLDATLNSIDPATGDVVGTIPLTPESTIPAIVDRARRAGRSWSGLSAAERVAILAPVGARLEAESERLGNLITREMGKPVKEARGEVLGIARGWTDELSEIAEAIQPESLVDEHTRSELHHDPYGVCAAITPWNFPIGMPHQLVIPALVAGNTVILKPSEETPLIGQAYVDILGEVLPAHVLQIVQGADAQGRALVAADVDFIAFTGSRETGKRILGAAAGGLKRVILELGGKDPMIVLRDADLDEAARFAVVNSFRNAGQVCVSTERIYVDDAVAEAFQERVQEFTAEMRLGPGTEDGVRVGPMINARQRDHVLAQLDAAIKDGAKVLAGGEGHHDNFVVPTVLVDVPEHTPIMREETFGPVACIARFTNEDDAVRLANGTPFGLGATVFGDPDHALAVARRLDAGMIGVNKSCGGAAGAPWVGAKESGYGFHSSRDGHRQFTQARVVSAPRN